MFYEYFDTKKERKKTDRKSDSLKFLVPPL